MVLTRKQQILAYLLGGLIVGGGLLTLYLMKAGSYLGDDPAACMNCHIMSPYYATWVHSSHSRNATCNDCHVPHQNAIKKWAFKGSDGIRHLTAFVTYNEPQVIRANDASSQVIMNNCVRCHQQLTSEFIKDGRANYMMTQVGQGKACWDCHRDIPHGGSSNLAGAPTAYVPWPESHMPEWLQKAKSGQD